MKCHRGIEHGAIACALLVSAMPVGAGTRTRNTAPTISGSPATTVQASAQYVFTPTAADAQNDTLRFSIVNKPTWASFNGRNGTLRGMPAAQQAGTYSNIVIRVSDGRLASSLPAFNITVTQTPDSNAPPVISGAPALSVTAGSPYSFIPTASDAEGNVLAFSVSNKPSWATFATATGMLSGTPSSQQAGTYNDIRIVVSDGTSSAALPGFSITVNPGAATGTTDLTWAAPLQNIDGTALVDLAGFKVYHGASASALTDVVQLEGAGIRAYTYPGLAAGTHYFAISAYSTGGQESPLSAVSSNTIP